MHLKHCKSTIRSDQSLSRVRLLQHHKLQHSRPPCPSPTPGVHPDPCPLNRWCHPTISSSVVPFSSCPQSFPASGSLQMSQLFASGGQSIGVSASGSVLPMNILREHLPLTKCYMRTCPLHKQYWKTMKISPVLLQVHDMFYSVTQLCLTLCDPMDCSTPGFPVLRCLPEFAQSHVHWVADAIQRSHLLSPPFLIGKASGSFPMSQLFASDGQSITVSPSVLPMNAQGWLPLGLTDLISLQSKGLSRVFSKTTVKKHQFCTQPSLWSSSYIHHDY